MSVTLTPNLEGYMLYFIALLLSWFIQTVPMLGTRTMTMTTNNTITIVSCGTGTASEPLSIDAFNGHVESGAIVSNGNGYLFFAGDTATGGDKTDRKERAQANNRIFRGAGYSLSFKGPNGKQTKGEVQAFPTTRQAKAKPATVAPIASVPIEAPIALVQRIMDDGQIVTNNRMDELYEKLGAITDELEAISNGGDVAKPAIVTIDGGYVAGRQPTAVSLHGPVTSIPGPTDAELTMPSGHMTYYARMRTLNVSAPDMKAAWKAARTLKGNMGDGVASVEVAAPIATAGPVASYGDHEQLPKLAVVAPSTNGRPARESVEVVMVPFCAKTLAEWHIAQRYGATVTTEQVVTMRATVDGKEVIKRMKTSGKGMLA